MRRTTRAVRLTVVLVLTGIGVASALIGAFAALAAHLNPLDVGTVPAIIAFSVSGLVLATHRPGNAVGWLMLLVAIAMGGVFSASAYGSWALIEGVDGPFAQFSIWVSGWAFLPLIGCLALLMPLVFPDGRLPSPRWRIVLGADLLFLLLGAANLFLDQSITLEKVGDVPNPYGIPAFHSVLSLMIPASLPFLIVGLAGSVAAVVLRFRRSRGAERQQMKFAALALCLAPLPFVVYDFSEVASYAFFLVVLPLVPVAIGVAVLRYRLYEIDRIVSRTVSYAIVTGLLVGVYVGCVAILTDVLPLRGDVGTAASVLAAVALFAPLRRRVQSAVDRRFNRSRYDAERVVEEFSARLRNEVDLDILKTDLLGVVDDTVAPARAGLWLRDAR